MNDQISHLLGRLFAHMGTEFMISLACMVAIIVAVRRNRLSIFTGMLMLAVFALATLHFPPSSSIIRLIDHGLGHSVFFAAIVFLLWVTYFPVRRALKHPNIILCIVLLVSSALWIFSALMFSRRSGASAEAFLYKYELARLESAVNTGKDVFEAVDIVTYRPAIKGPEKELAKLLLEVLKNYEGRSRSKAAELLAEMGVYEAIPELLAVVVTVPPDERPGLEGSLEKLSQAPEAFSMLEKLAINGRQDLKPEALRLIASHHPDRGEVVLMKLLTSDDPQLRSFSARFLGVFNDSQRSSKVIKGLEDALQDSNEDVRISATRTLESLAESLPARKFMTTSVYSHLLETGNIEQQRAAAHILGLLRSKKTAPELVKALESDDKVLKLYVLEALGRIHVPSAIEPVAKLFSDPDEEVRLAAVKYFRQLAPRDLALDSPSLIALRKLLEREKSDGVMLEATLTACWLDLKEAMGIMVNLAELQSKDQADVQDEKGLAKKHAAVECMIMIGDASAVSHLAVMLNDANAEIRHEAIGALVTIGDPNAIPALEKLLKNSDPDTQGLAIDAIDSLKEIVLVTPMTTATDEISIPQPISPTPSQMSTSEMEFPMEGLE